MLFCAGCAGTNVKQTYSINGDLPGVPHYSVGLEIEKKF
jgi:hypothetical protein